MWNLGVQKRAGDRRAWLPRLILVALVGGGTFVIAYLDGGYGLAARGVLATLLWWGIGLGIGLAVMPLARLTAETIWLGVSLAVFAVWTLASTAWAWDAARAVDAFNLAALYLAVFLLGALAGHRRTVDAWVDGLTVAMGAVAVVALVSRVFPNSFPSRGITTYLPSGRLSFPLGYWNGLGIFVAMSLPLLLRWMQSRRAVVAGLGAALFPLVGGVIYLTSSRGAVAVGGVALIAAVLVAHRWRAAVGAVTGVVGVAAAAHVFANRPELTNSVHVNAVVRHQGHTAAPVLLGIAVVLGVGWAFVSRIDGTRITPPRWFGWLTVAVVVAAAAAGIALAHPIARFDAFKQPLNASAIKTGGFAQAHLLSGNGSGRWQFWDSALDEWRSAPIVGRGAGTYEAWWAQRGSFSYFLVNAHSLYLEVLGELGIVGFLLLLVFVVGALITGVRRWRSSRTDAAGALLALALGWTVGVGIDWMWQLTVVTAVAMLALGLLASGATTAPDRIIDGRPNRRRRPRFALGITVVAMAWACIVVELIPILSSVEIRASQDAIGQGDGVAAARAATRARAIQPWASSPYLQLALVSERVGALGDARHWIESAIARSNHDWRLWLVAARLETKSGHVRTARQDLLHAARLNPRSPLFKGLLAGRTR